MSEDAWRAGRMEKINNPQPVGLHAAAAD